jgi:hypothetical protein
MRCTAQAELACTESERDPSQTTELHAVIRRDFERGFIACEAITHDDFLASKDELGAKEAGKMRVENKDYSPLHRDGGAAVRPLASPQTSYDHALRVCTRHDIVREEAVAGIIRTIALLCSSLTSEIVCNQPISCAAG